MPIPEKIKDVYASANCIFTKDEIESALDRMAAEMNVRLADTNPIFLCVLIGGIIPMGNLMPRLNFHLEVDYIHATRYKGNTKGGELHWQAKPTISMHNRTIVIVDDILDNGVTLKAIVNHCNECGAEKVYTAVMIDKEKDRSENEIQTVDFSGLKISDRFVFGYGLDYGEYLRNAPGIYVVAPEHE